ncbi:MAG: ABC transporter ATP-binding protein [Candidatus Heimdallarchaeota archaeon]|nr:ABC transporter ATP-binding protein [Candidatus Heimdallarchaeota archaeon]
MNVKLETIQKTTNLIEINNLQKIFEDKNSLEDLIVLDNLTLSIEKGEIFGLLGTNGAGKTTLINILSGSTIPTHGEVKIDGFDVIEEFNRIKDIINICPQEFALFDYMSGMENIEFFAALYSIPKYQIQVILDEILTHLGLEHAISRKSKHYSGGMKRQLNLIISLLNQPSLLFLDEPTVGMDPRVRRKTWELINSFKNEERTIILTTHYIEEAEALCDRVAILDYGKLIELGRPEDLLKKYDAKNLEEVFLKITGRRIMEGVQ